MDEINKIITGCDQEELELSNSEEESSTSFDDEEIHLKKGKINIEGSSLCDQRLIDEINLIPHRLAFKIGDVATLLGIKQYVLRYWETEFEELQPCKSKTNQRVFTRKDVEVAFLIKKLLYRDRFSIEGARTALKSLRSDLKREKNWQEVKDHIANTKEEVGEMIENLRRLQRRFSSI